MLVITRKRGESFDIGNDAKITVLHSGRSTVRLGIVAPPHIRVTRAEAMPPLAGYVRRMRPTEPPTVGVMIAGRWVTHIS